MVNHREREGSLHHAKEGTRDYIGVRDLLPVISCIMPTVIQWQSYGNGRSERSPQCIVLYDLIKVSFVRRESGTRRGDDQLVTDTNWR